ncbi:MAG: hypothetical protein LBH68_00340 [Bifidobacteriaceae bacterium]|jgi:hypothetical protein|nr:hypothetical protein [Bifidobacteriaceae bacterium]
MVGAIGLALAGAVLTALPAQAVEPACPPGICDVVGTETHVVRPWSVNGPLVLEDGEVLRVVRYGGLTLADGASISGGGTLILEDWMDVTGADVVISVPVEVVNSFPSYLGSIWVKSSASLTLDKASVTSGGPIDNYGRMVFKGGSTPAESSNLISNGTIWNEGVMWFESGSETGSTSKLVNNYQAENFGHVYLLRAEFEDNHMWTGDEENAPLFSVLWASGVFKNQDDEGQIVAGCIPTLTVSDSGGVPAWAQETYQDGVGLAFFYKDYQFELTAPTSCSYGSKAQPFLGWGKITGPLESVEGTHINLDPLTPAYGEYTMTAQSAVFLAAYGSLEPLPVPPPKPTLPPTGPSTAAVVQPVVGGGLLIGIGLVCLGLAARRRRALA